MLASTKIGSDAAIEAKGHVSKLADRMRGIETEEERFDIARGGGRVNSFGACETTSLEWRGAETAAALLFRCIRCPLASCYINAGAMLGLITLDARNLFN